MEPRYPNNLPRSLVWPIFPISRRTQWPPFTSPPSLDPAADPVTNIPGDRFGADILERGLSEAIKTDLLFGELELVVEGTDLHHRKKPSSVSLLDMLQQQLPGEAKVSAFAQGIERFVLRPDLDALSQPSLPDKLH